MQLDPEIAAVLDASPFAAFDVGNFDLEGVPRLRKAMANAPLPPLPPTTTVFRDQTITGPQGAPDVVLRIYTPPHAAAGDARPCVYWIHGGGYMFGSALTDNVLANKWVEDLDCVVVSVEYRLAPECAHPGPLEDCYVGLKWTAQNAAAIGIDPARIVIAGASAGGGLAAGLALLTRDRGEVNVCFQLLIYPMIDDRCTTTSSQMTGAAIWSRSANLLGWRAYLGHDPAAADVSPYAAAARATDLAGLPPAFIGVGTLDVFRDEDVTYALRLLAADVPTELHVYPGAPHGFELLAPGAAVSRRFRHDLDDALRRALSAN